MEIVTGDITEFEGDAIVNPANTLMIMGGGVAGAIKARGGPEIEEEARRRAPVPIGEAIATTAGRLRARYVIHAPTVETPGGPSRPEWVYAAARAAIRLAKQLGLTRIAMPLMGAGVGGVPPEESYRQIRRAVEGDPCLDVYLYVRDPQLAERLRNL